MATGGNRLVVAAFDFGTTYSGWAFSLKNDFQADPCKVQAKIWGGNPLSSLKDHVLPADLEDLYEGGVDEDLYFPYGVDGGYPGICSIEE
ncbi:hypothetical protein DPMN_043444 [Dreissena polymorpha]|uniref:Uncharacterized protein n=1 Tax=Dreissena polymorpha TaxID=45954 RepID=A0A9D4HXU9_DREPO|nr:hypothetical protein DPMN_043444 [Dreissena polymorpha]